MRHLQQSLIPETNQAICSPNRVSARDHNLEIPLAGATRIALPALGANMAETRENSIPKTPVTVDPA
jgi:hypothetical protein